MLTTSSYNLGAPVNVYLTGADSLQELSADSATLPSRFWIVYRPWLPEERARVQAVEAQGWTVAKERYFSRRPSDTYGAIAALLVR